MTAKKHWLNKIYHDSQQYYGSTQGNISWSTSESDDEYNSFIDTRKKAKTENVAVFSGINSLINPWAKVNNLQNYIGISDEIEQFSPKLNNIIEKHCLKKLNPTEVNLLTSNHSCESPIINNTKLEELSPVLNKYPDGIDKIQSISPILGNKTLWKKKQRYKRIRKTEQKECKTSEKSPDLFPDQSTQIIECDSPSPDPFTRYNSSITECNTEHICSFPTQSSSQVINSNSGSSLSRTDNSSLYHQPVPMPRNRGFKKGGLASQVQKALQLQKTRTAIWQHEVYTKKMDNTMRNDGEIIEFIIKREWKEYGSILLECESVDIAQNGNTYSIPSSTSKNSESKTYFFVLIIGFSTPLNISYKVDCSYKLLPPYSVKIIKYKSRDIPCYFNVTKVMLSKEEHIFT